MEFPSNYFEDEVRDGFYVSAFIKRAWAAQLEMLNDIDIVCKKHNISYFAEWGTLLGAIRHGGFVPWDDDLDICMLRDDYEKFLKVAYKDMPPYYDLLNFENTKEEDYMCDDYLTRIYSGNRVRIDKEYLDKFHGFPYVAGIDIFPLDYMAPTAEEDKKQCDEIVVIGTFAEVLGAGMIDKKEKEEYARGIEALYGVKLDRGPKMRKQLYALAEKVCARYNDKKEQSEYISSIALRTTKDYKVPKKCYEEMVRVPFENTTIPVPVGYDEILKIKYGDYMKAVRDGGSHEYPFYKRQEEEFEKKYKPLFAKYVPDKQELKRDEEMEQTTLKSFAVSMMQLLEQAKSNVETMMLKEEWEAALQLLQDCQEGAIALGNKIEEIKGEGNPSVHVLEQYCETLYCIYQAILGEIEMDMETALGLLQDGYSQLKESVQKEIIDKKVAVFLPYKACMWDSLESVWKAADEDPDCDAYVVPIPYYDKNFDGSLADMHYEGDLYPDYVPVRNYETFDFGILHPDMIFIHNPYDEYNIATSVHPYFYSRNLKKFTDKLVYIPYFVLDEIKPTDERAVKSMEHFCNCPGVIHSDVVIVQSEAMRKAYIEALVNIVGKDTRAIWEKKVLGLGSPKYDKIMGDMQSVQVPEEWRKVLYKENGEKKKVILYNIGLGSIPDHRDAMLDKIESVLKMFEENQDELVLLWRPHPLIKATIQSMCPELSGRYEKIVNEYCEKGFGIYDDTADLDRAIKISDAYYGDPSSVIQLCRKVGMPAMVQNVDIL